jgi:hypothetical protein
MTPEILIFKKTLARTSRVPRSGKRPQRSGDNLKLVLRGLVHAQIFPVSSCKTLRQWNGAAPRQCARKFFASDPWLVPVRNAMDTSFCVCAAPGHIYWDARQKPRQCSLSSAA